MKKGNEWNVAVVHSRRLVVYWHLVTVFGVCLQGTFCLNFSSLTYLKRLWVIDAFSQDSINHILSKGMLQNSPHLVGMSDTCSDVQCNMAQDRHVCMRPVVCQEWLSSWDECSVRRWVVLWVLDLLWSSDGLKNHFLCWDLMEETGCLEIVIGNETYITKALYYAGTWAI